MLAKLIDPQGNVTELKDDVYNEVVLLLKRLEAASQMRKTFLALDQLSDDEKPSLDEISAEIKAYRAEKHSRL